MQQSLFLYERAFAQAVISATLAIIPAVRAWLAILLAISAFLLGSHPSAAAFAMEAQLDVCISSSPMVTLTVNGVDLLALPLTERNAQLARELVHSLGTVARGGSDAPVFAVWRNELVIALPARAPFTLALSRIADPSGDEVSLARTLKERWEQAVAAGQLRAEPSAMTIPVGESRLAGLTGIDGAPILLMNPFPKLVDAMIRGNHLVITGIREGAGFLLLRQREKTLRVSFATRRLAAYFPERLGLQLTGSGYEFSELSMLSQVQLTAESAIAPGASLAARLLTGTQPYYQGMTLEASAVAPGRIKVTRCILVEVRRAEFTPSQPNTVLFSNEPEQITEPGRLLAATLAEGDRIRLVYHHQNRAGEPVRLRVRLSNLGKVRQRVFFRGGASDSDLSTLSVGLVSVRNYLRQLAAEQGCVLTLAGSASAVLWEGVLGHLESASGNLDLIVMSKGPLALVVDAETATSRHTVGLAQEPPLFRPASLRQRFRYDLDGHWLFIRLGQGEMRNTSTNAVLVGDYGLMEDLEVSLVNSQGRPRHAELSFDATAGEARGVFLLDGRLLETPPVYPGTPHLLERFEVPACGSRRVHIITMPLNGSHYPASLVFSCSD